MPTPLRGPVPSNIRRRTSFGSPSVISCATKPPIENPHTSSCWGPSAFDECYGVSSHLFERARNLSRAARDASVVEQNDFSLSREAIEHRWIPMVHSAGVVLVEDEWYAGCLTEAAIGK